MVHTSPQQPPATFAATCRTLAPQRLSDPRKTAQLCGNLNRRRLDEGNGQVITEQNQTFRRTIDDYDENKHFRVRITHTQGKKANER